MKAIPTVIVWDWGLEFWWLALEEQRILQASGKDGVQESNDNRPESDRFWAVKISEFGNVEMQCRSLPLAVLTID